MNKSMEIILTTLSPLLTSNYSSTLSSSSSSSLSSSYSFNNNDNSDTMMNNTISNNNNNNNNITFGNNFERFSDSLSHNYSLLLNKLEKLALNSVLSSTISPDFQNIFKHTDFDNFDQQKKQNFLNQLQHETQQQLLKYSGVVTGNNIHINNDDNNMQSSNIVTEDTTIIHTISDAEYSRFISDIWIGIVLTLLILSIVFFICSCFLYHKFQQWKNSYRTNNSEPEIVRRYDIDVESLPSYTLVSGLPTYDDAIEQFRKAGIIIQQPSVIKMFEDLSTSTSTPTKIPLTSNGIILHDELRDTNSIIRNNDNVSLSLNSNTYNNNNNNNNNNSSYNNSNSNCYRNDNDSNQFDNISLTSSCSCGNIINNSNNNNSNGTPSSNVSNLTTMSTLTGGTQSSTTLSNLTSVIELNPEQLRMLSQKRLSLQIALTNNNNYNTITPTSSLRLSSSSSINPRRARIDLFREISRNNLLRSHDIPQIHHSTTSLNNNNSNCDDRSFLAKRLMRNLQHRGSLS